MLHYVSKPVEKFFGRNLRHFGDQGEFNTYLLQLPKYQENKPDTKRRLLDVKGFVFLELSDL